MAAPGGDDEAQRFAREGYAVVHDAVPGGAVAALAAECDALAATRARLARKRARAQEQRATEARRGRADADADAASSSESDEDPLLDPFERVHVAEDDPVRTDARAWLRARSAAAAAVGASECAWAPDGPLARLVLSQLPEMVARLLGAAARAGGARVVLFSEHYVRKPARTDAVYAWHTDAAEQLPPHPTRRGVCARSTARYVSVWVALDPVGAHNGGVRVLPRPAARELGLGPLDDGHVAAERVEAAAPCGAVRLFPLAPGACAAWGSDVWHASGPNRAAAARRAYMAQYALVGADDEAGADGGALAPLSLAVPPLRATARRAASGDGAE